MHLSLHLSPHLSPLVYYGVSWESCIGRSIYLSFSLPINSYIFPPIPTHLSIYASIYAFIYLSTKLSIYPPIYTSIYLPTYIPVPLHICMCIYLCLSWGCMVVLYLSPCILYHIYIYIYIYIQCLSLDSGCLRDFPGLSGAFATQEHRENLTLLASGPLGSRKVGLGSRRGHLAREHSARSHFELKKTRESCSRSHFGLEKTRENSARSRFELKKT